MLHIYVPESKKRKTWRGGQFAVVTQNQSFPGWQHEIGMFSYSLGATTNMLNLFIIPNKMLSFWVPIVNTFSWEAASLLATVVTTVEQCLPTRIPASYSNVFSVKPALHKT